MTAVQLFTLVCLLVDCPVLIACCDLQRALSDKQQNMARPYVTRQC